MFTASMILHSFGNDITSGTVYPYNTLRTIAMPLGHDCQHAAPSTPNGAPNDRYCATTTLMAGYPATGSGYLVTGGATAGAPVGLPQSAFAVDVTGFHRTYYPYIQSHTYGEFVNAAGTFFAGGGPAFGEGTHTHSGMGQRSGQWIIHEGPRGFGGILNILGAIGDIHFAWIITGKVGTYTGGPGNWNMVTAFGNNQYTSPTGYTPMGKTLWRNPHFTTNFYTNNENGNVTTVVAIATGTPWTTGSVTLYANAGIFATVLHRAGYDTVTAGGVRNLQLVTPAVTHWISPGWQSHSGQIGILTMQISPEPRAILLLAAGGGVLALLYLTSRRR
jgi:hypothetical protein